MAENIVSKYDRNMLVETKLTEPDLCFYDVRKAPFRLYGLYNPTEQEHFLRLPEDVAKATSEGVAHLSRQTAGGRLRFSTDSAYVALKAVMPAMCHMDHMAMTGSTGFDLYIDSPIDSRYYRTFRPSVNAQGGFETIIRFPDRKLRNLTIHFPTYSPVKDLYIGLQEGAVLEEGMPYQPLPPFVIYGSSITQGGCCSRPGLCYSNALSRRLNLDHINLGFSGSGRAEEVIVQYMSDMEMSAFICDYDHNAPNAAHLIQTHLHMYEVFREKHPTLPYIMMSLPDFDRDPYTNAVRRDIVQDTFRRARAAGDKNIYFIDGEGVFRGPDRDSCTVDGCHPNDIGMTKIADAMECMLRRALRGVMTRV